MNREPRDSRLLMILAVLALAGAPSCRGEVASARAPLPKVVVLPFKIEPLPVTGAPEPLSRRDFIALLGEEAAASAARTMVSEGLTETVERSPSSGGTAGQLMLRGSVRLPVRLPADLHDLRDDVQRGPLASASVTLLDAGGMVLRKANAELDWREVQWQDRPFRFRRERSAEEVLIDASAEVARRAVQHLGTQLRKVQ